MTIEKKSQVLSETVGTDVGEISRSMGDLSELSTTNTGSIVEAINELNAMIKSFGKSVIDDMS